MEANVLEGGFSDPAIQAAQCFRAIMEATARPGSQHVLDGVMPPAPLSVAAGAVLLTLCDRETPLHLSGAFDCDAVRAWITFHTGAPFVGPADCMFALGLWDDLLPISAYPVGTSEYPDRSATLIVEEGGVGADHILTGPGIRDTATESLPETQAFKANRALFPLGLDFLFTRKDRISGLPRSTCVKLSEAS